MRSIEITFTTLGETKIEAHGFKGKECKLKTEPFEKALGTVTEDKNKPEFYQNTNLTQKQTA